MSNVESPFLDRNEEIRMREGRLTLWDQINKIQHATFHLKDSIPLKERNELIKNKASFEKINPRPWDKDTQKRYHSIIGKRQEELLDKGYGNCVLKDIEIRRVVENSLEFYNEEYYNLLAYVIMPNHVHVLLIMEEEYEIEDILGRLKRFTARKINRILGRKGELWTKENYCRLMRSLEHYKITENYIKNNPRFLKRGEYSLKIF